MSEPEGSVEPRADFGEISVLPKEPDPEVVEIDFKVVATWLREHPVLVFGTMLIVAEIAWKAQFLHHLYFFQDDYVALAIASKSQFNWHYLSLVGAGHLFPGLRAVTWLLARASLYNWNLDTAVLLAFLACACLAALRLLRTMFGERPAILIPLAIYLLTPLTVPDLGWWWCGMESVPFQLSIFMTINAHVLYVRTGRAQHLVASSLWLVFGLLFFEKAMIVPLLLFGLTAGFLMGSGSVLRGARSTLRRHWKAWLVYAVLMIGYTIAFVEAFRTSAVQPQAPYSLSAAWTFAWVLVKDTLFTGAIGGPWQWFPAGGLYALGAAPVTMIWLAAIVGITVIAASVLIRPTAWRAWVMLAGWVLAADVVPVLVGRLHPGIVGLLGLETRYLADAACILAICVGLAFWPVVGVEQTAEAVRRKRRIVIISGNVMAGRNLPNVGQLSQYGAAAVIGVFVFGSIWSDQAYEAITPGAPAAASYIAHAEKAVKLAPRGTNVLNVAMPPDMVNGVFGQYSKESWIIGDMERGRLAGKLRWITTTHGTIDGLKMFGADGKLYPAVVSGVYAETRKGQGFVACWPEKNGQIVVRFQQATNVFDWTLYISYIWGSTAGQVTVLYGHTAQQLAVTHGVHAAYLPVTGAVNSFTVTGLGGNHMCIGSAAAGQLVPF